MAVSISRRLDNPDMAKKKNSYRVTYEVDVFDLDSPEAAAVAAFAQMVDPASMPPILSVVRITATGKAMGPVTEIDLEEFYKEDT